MSVSLALKKEGVGLQPKTVRSLLASCLTRLLSVFARDVRPNQEHINFLIDHEAERYTSRHLQIYLSMGCPAVMAVKP
ncbi:MAG: hypothetical protein Q8L63_00020 [Alphaproteobacteria bacterium]|nr:hypothetical protein [Alphaproteobacteria bacterium]